MCIFLRYEKLDIIHIHVHVCKHECLLLALYYTYAYLQIVSITIDVHARCLSPDFSYVERSICVSTKQNDLDPDSYCFYILLL